MCLSDVSLDDTFRSGLVGTVRPASQRSSGCMPDKSSNTMSGLHHMDDEGWHGLVCSSALTLGNPHFSNFSLNRALNHKGLLELRSAMHPVQGAACMTQVW